MLFTYFCWSPFWNNGPLRKWSVISLNYAVELQTDTYFSWCEKARIAYNAWEDSYSIAARKVLSARDAALAPWSQANMRGKTTSAFCVHTLMHDSRCLTHPRHALVHSFLHYTFERNPDHKALIPTWPQFRVVLWWRWGEDGVKMGWGWGEDGVKMGWSIGEAGVKIVRKRWRWPKRGETELGFSIFEVKQT